MNEYERRLQEIPRESCEKERALSSENTSPIPNHEMVSYPQTKAIGDALSIATVDVFTSTPFHGNQLAIVRLPHGDDLAQETKQAIAREFAYSETVFLFNRSPNIENERRLAIFTPSEELPFAGHPVIGAAWYFCEHLEPGTTSMTMRCRAGCLKVHYDQKEQMAEAEVPAAFHIHKAAVNGRAVLKTQPYLARTSVIMSELPVVSIVKGMSFILVNLPSIQPHLEKLEPGPMGVDVNSVQLDEDFAPSFVGCYFYAVASHPNERIMKLRTRMLEPKIGEDAATGSAACTLATYLAMRDGKLGKEYRYAIEQGVEMGRASEIYVTVKIAAARKAIETVHLAGRAILVSQGSMYPCGKHMLRPDK